MNKLLIGLISIVSIGIIGFFVFYIGWVSYIDNYEFGYTFDRQTGKIDSLDRKGYVITPLLTKVYTIDTRPMQLSISTNTKVLNAKLVKFNTAGYLEFIAWHGVGNYSATNTITDFKDILIGYAFDPSDTKYPFLTILKELKNENTTVIETNISVSKADTIK
jgi:hypothetical protein